MRRCVMQQLDRRKPNIQSSAIVSPVLLLAIENRTCHINPKRKGGQRLRSPLAIQVTVGSTTHLKSSLSLTSGYTVKLIDAEGISTADAKAGREVAPNKSRWPPKSPKFWTWFQKRGPACRASRCKRAYQAFRQRCFWTTAGTEQRGVRMLGSRSAAQSISSPTVRGDVRHR
jgi:hypothetical protein